MNGCSGSEIRFGIFESELTSEGISTNCAVMSVVKLVGGGKLDTVGTVGYG